jgi:seryl-tRNA synthetase
MLDIKYVRENYDEVVKKLSKRNLDVKKVLDPIIEKDKLRREKLTELENMRKDMNSASGKIAMLKKGDNKDELQKAFDSLKILSDNIKTKEIEYNVIEKDFTNLMLNIPNIPQEDVPIGKSEENNVVVREHGVKPFFDFKVKDHVDIGEKLGILDMKRASKITGARFPLLLGLGAKIERALINFMLDNHSQTGYKEVVPPFMVNSESLIGTGQLPKFEAELFKCLDTDYYLIPTAEVPVTNIHRGEILKEEELPIKYVAYTPCFRKEAGSYGKDTRGLIRNHQFNKIELVKFVKPEESRKELESLVKDASLILEKLGLAYRVICLCGGDLGFSSSMTYDLEVWMPSENKYREVSSCSTFTDFQARRANIRYKTKENKTEFVHTLNGSGLAVGRIFAALLENYQTKDGELDKKILDILKIKL